jgi:alanine racemase
MMLHSFALKDCSVSDPWHDGRTGLLTIELDALADNWRRLRDRLSPETDCAGVVKANGYGLGIEPVVRALAGAGCRTFFVAQLPEGRRVRAVAPAEARVFVLSGPPPGTDRAFPEAGLIPVLNSLEQVDRWLAQCPGAPSAVHLDTGMARLGLGAEEVSALLADPDRLAALAPVLVMSHLVAADEPGDPTTRAQIDRFRDLRAAFPGVAGSLANSSGIFMGPDAHHDLVRPGVALYGVNPTPGRPNPMAPVVRLQGRILQVRRVDAVSTVGYGASHLAARGARLATVGIGYADGLPRSTSSGLVGRLRGVPVPLVGRVSMDLTTFDVSAVPLADGPRPGDAIDLIGPLNPVDDMAARAGTIGYEILTALGPRHARVYLGRAAQEGSPRP